MKNLIARFVKDQSGATAIEYGLIAAGIALAIITTVNTLGTNLNGKFNSINSSITQNRQRPRMFRGLCFFPMTMAYHA